MIDAESSYQNSPGWQTIREKMPYRCEICWKELLETVEEDSWLCHEHLSEFLGSYEQTASTPHPVDSQPKENDTFTMLLLRFSP